MYTDTTRWEVTRAVGLGLAIAGGFVSLMLLGQLLAWREPHRALPWLGVMLAGIALVVIARRRLEALWRANRPYLMGEAGTLVLQQRREREERMRRLGRWLFAVFLVAALGYLLVFSIRQCQAAEDAFCERLPLTSDGLLGIEQIAAVVLGAAWAALTYLRRRHEDQTERTDVVVAEGQRRRRGDNPLAGSERFAWE